MPDTDRTDAAADEFLRRTDFQRTFKMCPAKFFQMKREGKLPFFRKINGTLITTRSEAFEWYRSQSAA